MKIAIIGAGLSGRLLAWQLLEQGCSVSLYDRDNGDGAQSAGAVAAAMLAPFSEIIDAEPVVYQQGMASIDTWRQWVSELEAGTGLDLDLRTRGSLVVSHRQDMGDYQRFVQRLKANPVVDQSLVKQLDHAGIKNLEPAIAERFDRACYLEAEACLDNSALYVALARRIHELGGLWFTGQNINKLDAAMFSGFDRILDCRGFGAHESVNGLRGVRGEVIRVQAPEVDISRPVRLMHPRYKLYIAPKPSRHYVIGATSIESHSEHAITVRSSLELLSALYSVHSGFAEAEVLLQSARCRPAFIDNLPGIIDRGKVLHINGLYRHGYLLSPSVVLQVLYQLGVGACSPWPGIVDVVDEKKGYVA